MENNKWGPRPAAGWRDGQRAAYFAGYSDAFYGYDRYTAYTSPNDAPLTYGLGFDDGLKDGSIASEESA